jgi:hypothetical protein
LKDFYKYEHDCRCLLLASLLSAAAVIHGQEVYPAAPFPEAGGPYPYPVEAIPPGYFAVNEAELAAAKAIGLGGGLELGPIGRNR